MVASRVGIKYKVSKDLYFKLLTHTHT